MCYLLFTTLHIYWLLFNYLLGVLHTLAWVKNTLSAHPCLSVVLFAMGQQVSFWEPTVVQQWGPVWKLCGSNIEHYKGIFCSLGTDSPASIWDIPNQDQDHQSYIFQ